MKKVTSKRHIIGDTLLYIQIIFGKLNYRTIHLILALTECRLQAPNRSVL